MNNYTDRDEALCSIALTKALPLHYTEQRALLEHYGSASQVYAHRHSVRQDIEEATDSLAQALAEMDSHISSAEQELDLDKQSGIKCLCLNDDDYPRRLRECPDAPIVLFTQGPADLNAQHVISIVGTRRCTEYGRGFLRRFLADLAQLCPGTLVVSGLAYGIDIAAHLSALENNLPTAAVLAHGMEQIYPPAHRGTANRLSDSGALVTEYTLRHKMGKVNFISRNRIVAGLADASLVIESKAKGGALITARLAGEYGREVYALTGRVGDEASEGCIRLLLSQKAQILATACDFLESTGWLPQGAVRKPVQRELFPELSAEEKAIVSLLRQSDNGLNLTQLTNSASLPLTQLTTTLYELELKGVIKLGGAGLYFVV